jgi:uncharacterized membrane protein YdbT with pleckstrin-like domain
MVGFPQRQLGADEQVVLHIRTHAKAMILPALGLVVAGAMLGVGTALVPSHYRPVGQWLVVVVAVLLAWWWSVLPFFRWRCQTYTITNHRLLTRQGVLTKTGQDLPLVRINDVSYQRSLSDRIFGCGSLYLRTAAVGAAVLDDVPDVEHVHLVLTELLFAQPSQGQPPDQLTLADHDDGQPHPGGWNERARRHRRWPSVVRR